MNAIVEIAPATRAGAHLLIQLFGGPQCGKTLSALLLARGIAGPTGKIGVLDTESGRAKFFADKIPGGFFHADLSPPFTADRYKASIEEFVKFGADVLVIDSFSHVWNGPGGVLEQADSSGKAGLQKWLKPKVEYRKLVGFLLSTRIHIIFCSRGKQQVVEQVVNGSKTLVTMPWEPVQDKHLKYEMTVVLPMLMNGTFETMPERLKSPGDLKHLFTGKPVTIETGATIAEWVAGGTPINHAHELLRKRANDAASDGTDAFREYWKLLPDADKAILKANIANYQSIAKAADEERKEAANSTAGESDGQSSGQTAEQPADKLPDDPFAKSGGQSGAEPERVQIHQREGGGSDWARFHQDAMAAIATLSPDQVADWTVVHHDAIRNCGTAKKQWETEIRTALGARATAA